MVNVFEAKFLNFKYENNSNESTVNFSTILPEVINFEFGLPDLLIAQRKGGI